MKPDLERYWRNEGKRYFDWWIHHDRGPYDLQIEKLMAVLRRLRKVDSILELACGFGRITGVLRAGFPKARILAYDLSPDQLARAKSLVKDASFVQGDVMNIDPGNGFDLVVATEFYMHVPDDDFRRLIGKIGGWSKHYAINIDYTGPESGLAPTKDGLIYQFAHDYEGEYVGAGFRRVKKIGLPQQTLFVAEKARPGFFH